MQVQTQYTMRNALDLTLTHTVKQIQVGHVNCVCVE